MTKKKYWKLRSIVTNPTIKKPRIIKMFYLVRLKKMEARNACSLGTTLNAGAIFKSPPILPHGITGIFVSHQAIIGKNCLILQNVTIGSAHGKAPVIGDNCLIGANACVVGGVRVGNNCKIGAGCVVFKDVPDNTTVVAQAPRYISHNSEYDYKWF